MINVNEILCNCSELISLANIAKYMVLGLSFFMISAITIRIKAEKMYDCLDPSFNTWCA